MTDAELIERLREHAEWAEGNQWDTPITLSDDLALAAERIGALTDEALRRHHQVKRSGDTSC